MQKHPTRVAIYTRISEDPKRTGLGVERQREDCLALAERKGFTVIAEYCDNDKSAYKETVKRPGYEALLESVKAGEIDCIVAYKVDRLGRRLRTMIDLYDLLLESNTTIQLVAGDIDLATSHGIAMAQMAAVMAENYVRTSREANLRSRVQKAEKGGRHLCRRSYGWEDDGMTVRESEAIVVREICSRLIDGESPTSIAMDLNKRGFKTVQGKNWTGIGVRKCGTRASNAAIREHKGELYYNGQWQPIVTRETWEQVMLAITNRQQLSYKRGVGRKYLLTGFLFCACGNKLSATVGSGDRKPSYRCHSMLSNAPTRTGCGAVSRGIAPLEDFITEMLLARLDSPGMMEALSLTSTDKEQTTKLLAERDGLTTSAARLNEHYFSPDNALTDLEYRKLKRDIETKLEAVTRSLNRITYKTTISKVDVNKTLRQTWEEASVEWRRSFIELFIESITVHPYSHPFKRVYYKQWRFDPDLIEIKWVV